MIDSIRRIDDGSTLDCDVCVVGAGAAGIALALTLQAPGRRVLLLEAGGHNRAGAAQALYQGEVQPSERHLALDQARYRQLGGTTSLWGGRCIPYDSIDFVHRDWVPNSGWPIDRATLDPFYARAHDWLECGSFDYRVPSALGANAGAMLPGFADGVFDTASLERWSPPTHFGKAYGERLRAAAGVQVVLHAVVTGLLPGADGGTVRALQVRDARAGSARRGFQVRARRVVLAGGGLETTRLLLCAQRAARPLGLTGSAWLGRGYMSHVHGVLAELQLRPGVQPVAGYEQDASGVFVRRRLWLSEATQRAHRLLNMTALLDRPLLDDPGHGSAVLSAAFLAKKLLQRQRAKSAPAGKYGLYWQHLRNVLTGAPQVLSVLPRYARARFLEKRRLPSLTTDGRSGRYHLVFQSEQVPDAAAALRLLDNCDALGMPRLHLDFRVQPQDMDSVWRTHQLLDQDLQRQGMGKLLWAPDARERLESLEAVLGHHVGTTRMSDSVAHGVVNADARVHGIDNLYVASASVLPTSSHANPTLSVVALSLRLAHHLHTLER